MGAKTAISWLADAQGNPGATWEPTRGCSPCSPGCKLCWAKTYAHRFDGPGMAYDGFSTAKGWTGRVELDPKHLDDPLHWKKPRRIFVDSRSDLFHSALPDADVLKVFEVMRRAHNEREHTFLCLTKRAARMRDFCCRLRFDSGSLHGRRGGLWMVGGPYPEGTQHRPEEDRRTPFTHGGGEYGFSMVMSQLWLGVSVDDREHGLPRIEHLRATPARLRFLSIEPLLEGLGELDLTGIHWVIVGGESGPKARPFDLAWARSIRDQCKAAGVSFFMKQIQINGKAVSDPIAFPPDLQVREFPNA